MKGSCRSRISLARVGVLCGLVLLLVGSACAPAVAPTPTPTKAPPPTVATATPAPKVEPTKPAAPAATPTLAPPSKPTGKPIRIGLIAPFSGPVAPYGLSQKGAVLAALEDINNTGGINGSPLEVVEVDATAPAETVTMVRKLAESDKVFAIAGPLMSSGFDVAAPLANDLKLPVSSATANIPGVAGKNRPWSFQFMPSEAVGAPYAVAGFKKAYPEIKRMVIAGDSKNLNSYNSIKNVYPEELKKAGLEVLDTVPFETGTTDFAAIVTKVKGLNPQGLAVAALTPENLGFVKEAARQSLRVPAVSTVSLGGGPEITMDKEGFEGWVIPSLFDMATQEPRAKSFAERYVKFAEAVPGATKPAQVGAYGMTYDLIMALADIMRKNNVTPDTDLTKARTIIRDGLQNVKDFKGIGGQTITMQPDGSIAFPVEPYIGRGGKWVPLK